MSMRKTRHLLLVLASGISSLSLAAELNHNSVGASGAMVSACGGIASGGFPTEGNFFDWQAGKSVCNSALTAVPGNLVANSASYTQVEVVTDTHGSAQFGQVGSFAHFRANAHQGFAAAETTAGWSDTLTLQPLNLGQLGQNVDVAFTLHVHGVLDGVPSGNSYTRYGVQAWKDNLAVAGQSLRFQGQGQGGFPFHQAVDQNVTFHVTAKLGTAFNLGVFTRSSTGTAGSGPNWFSEATSDFAGTVTWQGISGVTLGGNAVAYTLSSTSGIDWRQPFTAAVPEPASWGLMLAGLWLLAWRRARAA